MPFHLSAVLSASYLSFLLFPRPSPSPHSPTPPPHLPCSDSFSLSHLARPSECSLVHRCILSIPLHYDSYIAIFIISAIHRCWRDRGLTSFPLLSHLVLLLFLDFVRFALSLCPPLRPPLCPPKDSRSRRVVPRFVRWIRRSI